VCKRRRSILGLLLAGGLALAGAMSTAPAQPTDTDQVNINIEVLPIAEIEILGSGLLYLLVPPPGSTIPSAGVDFIVRGNAKATVTAEPDAFMFVPGQGYIGQALLPPDDVEELGYRLELMFPSTFVLGADPSGTQTVGMPGSGPPGMGTPPLSANLQTSSGERDGSVHLIASQHWTADGSFPLPGIYVGSVTLTLTAENV
jgi:hypothetical protein